MADDSVTFVGDLLDVSTDVSLHKRKVFFNMAERHPFPYIHVMNYKRTCSKPPSNSVVSIELFMGSTCSSFPVRVARVRTNDDFPQAEAPT